jgi:DNA invertase Pin-like site-specific DNA recombinase
MKKVILLVRVSTVYQEYTEQTNELVAYAKHDGYADDEMIIIQDKESATKLNDEERQGLTKMYEDIDNPEHAIEAVYAWELSRLSRRPVTLHKLKEFLENRKIDLRIKDINFRLLNSNKEIIEHSDLTFSIFASFCKSEITQKVARVKRSKVVQAMEGHYGGGFRRFGYKVNSETKQYEIDDNNEAETVRLIFNLYATGKFGHDKLYKELLSRGLNVNIRLIDNVLKSRLYTGELIPKSETSYARRYPAIISTELFDKCKEVAKLNNTNIDKSKTVYFGNKLIKCQQCGRNMKATKSSVTYYCNHKYPTHEQPSCTCKDTININVLDSALWYLAKKIETNNTFNRNKQDIDELNNKIKDIEEKIINSENKYNIMLQNKFKELKRALPFPDDEVLKLATRSIHNDKLEIDKEKSSYISDLSNYKTLLADKTNTLNIYNTIKNIEDIKERLENLSDKEKYDLIHKHIKNVTISIKNKCRIIVIETFDKADKSYFPTDAEKTIIKDYIANNNNFNVNNISVFVYEKRKLMLLDKPTQLIDIMFYKDDLKEIEIVKRIISHK